MISGFKKEGKNSGKDKKQVLVAVLCFVLFVLVIVYMVKFVGPQKNSMPAIAPDVKNIPVADNANMNENYTENLNNEETPENLSQEGMDIYNKTKELKEQIAQEINSDDSSSDMQSIEQGKSRINGKTVTVLVEDSHSSVNPFLPAAGAQSEKIQYPVYLVPPPLEAGANYEATLAQKTTVSGIMFDTYSPSAILVIEGTDYLVKKGDIIKGYKILDITKDYVLIKLNKNVLRARVGEIPQLDGGMDFSKNISNLNSKFGGNVVVTISAKKPAPNTETKKTTTETAKKVNVQTKTKSKTATAVKTKKK